jgi:indole-3-acetate monooxygenase
VSCVESVLLSNASLIASQFADRTEQHRRLDSHVVDALKDASLFRLFVPAEYGGPALSVPEAMAQITELSRADGAAGWCSAIASTTSHVAGSMEPHWAHEIFGSPNTVTGGAFAPTAQSVANSNGLTVTGRWAWGSGSQHCDWICGGTMGDDGTFRIVFVPAADVTIHDTWFSSGLRGTGSHDFEMSGVHVPTGRWSLPIGGKPTSDDPVAKMPMYTLFAAAIASVMLGIARRALDEVALLAVHKRSMGSSKPLGELATTHIDLGQAEGIWRAASAWLNEEVGSAWSSIVAGDRVQTARKAAVRAAATHASIAARQVTDLAYDLGGGSAVYSTSPLQRCFRDVHTASAHIMVNRRNTETFGRNLLGLPIDTAML